MCFRSTVFFFPQTIFMNEDCLIVCTEGIQVVICIIACITIHTVFMENVLSTNIVPEAHLNSERTCALIEQRPHDTYQRNNNNNNNDAVLNLFSVSL